MSNIERLPKSRQKNRIAYGMSMRCPNCATEFSALLDKRNYSGNIRRNRMCENGHRFTTREVTDAEMDLLKAIEEEVNNLRDAAKKLLRL